MVHDLRAARTRQTRYLAQYLASGNQGILESYRRAVTTFRSRLQSLREINATDWAVPMLDAIANKQRKILALDEGLLAEKEAGADSAALVLEYAEKENGDNTSEINDFVRIVTEDYEQSRSDLRNAFTTSYYIFVASSASSVGLCIAVGIALFLSTKRQREIDHLSVLVQGRQQIIALYREHALTTIASSALAVRGELDIVGDDVVGVGSSYTNGVRRT